jgi:uncharacterized protein YjbI with pentapeptide repeats
MNESSNTQRLFPPQSPGQWKAYWRRQEQAWRTEPEISTGRQEELKQLRTTQTENVQNRYPSKERDLSRADIEWLLATHTSNTLIGPVDYDDEHQWKRRGIDISGSNLAQQNLSHLPLSRMIGGHTSQETTGAQKHSVAINLEKATLIGTHLEAANLTGARLKRANLSEAYLEDAQLNEAHLEGANLREAHLKGTDFTRASLAGANANRAYAEEIILRDAHLEGTHFSEAHLEGADLRRAFLKKTKFDKAFLEGADFAKVQADEEGADFSAAHLEGANFAGARLRGVNFRGAHLEGAIFSDALLEDADFTDAYLAGVDFREAHLEGADLRGSHLEGKKLAQSDMGRIGKWSPSLQATLPPADLREAFFSSATRLKDAVLGNKELGFISVADLSWGDANLNVIDWEHFAQPGDEYKAKKAHAPERDKTQQIEEYSAAVRANRQLAVILQSQGLNEVAARFSYRGQVLQRAVLYQQRKFVQCLFSLLLDLLTGYGYKPLRSFIAYLIVDIVFAVIYSFLDHDLNWLDAFILSVTTFGRGLVPATFTISDPMALVSIVEAFIGLSIEATFIAALTQRLFGK